IHPVNPVCVCQVEFWFAGCHACLLLVTVDFELGPLIAEFGRAQHVTGPEVVLACPAEQHAHVAVVTSVTFTHQADIVSPPCKIRFSG
ncbi:hypothetical protein ECPA4_3478, partial [Escherichia coli PA4]